MKMLLLATVIFASGVVKADPNNSASRQPINYNTPSWGTMPYSCSEGEETFRSVADTRGGGHAQVQQIFVCVNGKMVQKYAPVQTYVPYTGPQCTHDEVFTVQDNMNRDHSKVTYFYCINGKLVNASAVSDDNN